MIIVPMSVYNMVNLFMTVFLSMQIDNRPRILWRIYIHLCFHHDDAFFDPCICYKRKDYYVLHAPEFNLFYHIKND